MQDDRYINATATDHIERETVEECWRCRLSVTDDGKVIHNAGCSEG